MNLQEMLEKLSSIGTAVSQPVTSDSTSQTSLLLALSNLDEIESFLDSNVELEVQVKAGMKMLTKYLRVKVNRRLSGGV